MFWTDEERKLCPEEQTKAEIARLHDKHKIGDKEIERIVRDAIISYEKLYQIAPNDDCERELKERAAIGNKWLKDHGFEEEAEKAFLSEPCDEPCGNCTIKDINNECGVKWLFAEHKGKAKK